MSEAALDAECLHVAGAQHCDPQILAAIGDPIPIEIEETRLVALG